MALKDWKRKTTGLNKNFKEIAFEKKVGDGQISIVNDGERWRVWFVEGHGESDELKTSGFKTKARALKFARSYMRTH